MKCECNKYIPDLFPSRTWYIYSLAIILYGEKKTSIDFANDFPDIYKKITNEDIPEYIRQDIQDDNQYLLFKQEDEVPSKYLWTL